MNKVHPLSETLFLLEKKEFKEIVKKLNPNYIRKKELSSVYHYEDWRNHSPEIPDTGTPVKLYVKRYNKVTEECYYQSVQGTLIPSMEFYNYDSYYFYSNSIKWDKANIRKDRDIFYASCYEYDWVILEILD